jgi:hypothetical protein
MSPSPALAFLAAAFLATAASAADPSPRFCWRSLEPSTGPQNTGLAMVEESLALSAGGDLWLTWDDGGSKLRRFSKGAWSEPGWDGLSGIESHTSPIIASFPGGEPVVVLRKNRPDGSAALHVAQRKEGRWTWLGEPLLYGREPYTHANATTVTVDSAGLPVVAWTEELNIKLRGLFVARWDGREWQRLGTVPASGPDYYLAPALAIGPDQRVWLTWSEAKKGVRVALFDGKAWQDLGGKWLAKAAAGGQQAQLHVDGSGQGWLAWSVRNRHSRFQVHLARWDGKAWASVPRPPVETDEVDPKLVAGRHGPLLCSTRGPAAGRRVFCAEWSDGRWLERLGGLHVVEGVSSVELSAVLATEDGGAVLLWDESGSDTRTRVVQAYPCAQDEVPREPPRSVDERTTWPKTVDEAAREIAENLSEEDRATVGNTPRKDLIRFHHGWGTGIRNGLGLWRGNESLLSSCGKGKPVHPDDCSMVIIEAVWERLQPTRPQTAADAGVPDKQP